MNKDKLGDIAINIKAQGFDRLIESMNEACESLRAFRDTIGDAAIELEELAAEFEDMELDDNEEV